MVRTLGRLLSGAVWLVGIVAVTASGVAAAPAEANANPAAKVDYIRDVRPILAENCYICHGPDDKTRQARLRLDLKAEAFKEVIVPRDSSKSELVARLAPEDPDDLMPPAETGKKLTSRQIELIKSWIDQGANWTEHWAYVKPRRPAVPEVKNADWAKNAIDRFILARLEKEGLAPSPEADRAALIRRLSLDVTGLPPTPAEVDAFVADKSPDAYEKLVDRLLASPHYGERMAQDWLDQARYADTNGYHIDNHRDLWLWRDWVINAYNQNKPFDQFTIEQIAGDLLPNATTEQKIATGFNRNEMVNFEGGAIEEEYATKYVVGRVNTTSAVFLGSTMACAECHDHKYDPISTKEYYRFYAFFNNIAEKGLDGQRESPAPTLRVPTAEQARRLKELDVELAERAQGRQAVEAALAAKQGEWEEQVRAGAIKPVEPAGLHARYTLDELSTPAADAAGQNRAGVFRPAPAEGRLGRALRLTGDGAHVDLGNTGDFERTDAFSLGAWVNLEPGGGAIFAKMEGGPALRGYDVTVIDEKLFVHLIHTWEGNAIRVITREKLPTQRWQHVMVSYDGSGKAAGLKVYVNGREQALDVTHDKLTGTIKTAAPLRIGRREEGFALRGLVDDARIYSRALATAEVSQLVGEPALAIASIPLEKRTPQQKEELAGYYRLLNGSELAKVDAEIAGLRRSRQELESQIPVTMVMEERKDPRETRILVRGDYRNKGEVVTPGVPAFLPPLPKDMKPDRLALAKWMVDPDHPLVARVTVNRYWQRLFGVGIVKTSDDFGARAELPSHPELLDYLAREFIESGWDIKALHRLMLTSAAYRQSSVVSKDLHARDPQNRLLARGPRFRLTAEGIRDNALAASGLLNRKIGGPSVFPYQPAGLWEVAAFGGGFSAQTYVQSHGPDLYRRGIYVYWKRSMHYASFATFDAPNREICTVNRPRTNTPLQALVLLNDPVYVEAARALAERIMKEGGGDSRQRAGYAFRLCVARPPNPREVDVLMRIYGQQLGRFQNDKTAAAKLVSVGESQRDGSLDVSDLAAWTAVANMLLNLDETITKG